MSEPANQPDPKVDLPVDPLLAIWLREAADDPLTASHPAASADHLVQVRRTLLGALESASPVPAHPVVPSVSGDEPMRGFPGFWTRHRLAVGGVAASIALVGALLVAFHSNQPLSAMERMAKKLQEITSYSYRSTGSNTHVNKDGKRETRQDDCTVSWLGPDALHEEMKIVKIVEDAAGGNRTEETLALFEQVFRPGGSGVLVDHRHKTFDRIRYEPMIGSKTYPWDTLRMIREGSYDVLADLGVKRIGDTDAHGYRLRLKNPHDEENLVRDPVELWVDSKTNLPIEFGWSGESEGWKYTDRTSDFRWNIALDAKWFEPVIPEGYADITPPTEQSDLDQIAFALRLYAELSGGHYPRVKTFDPVAIRDEMLKMADSAAAADTEAAREKKHQQIEQSMAGLNWIARILRIQYLSGYRGLTVGPAEKDKVLFWWMTSDVRYRVFYADLQTEVLTEDQWSKLVPKEEIVGYYQSMHLERIAKKLFGVVSYSFRSVGTNTGIDNDGKRETIKDDHTVYWASPGAYRQETKIVKLAEDAAGGNRTEETLAHFEEVFPPGKPGLFIDHYRQTFVRVPSEPIGTYVWDGLRMIREGSYDVLADLGTKRIGETQVHGYRLALKNPRLQNPVWIMQLRDPLELWVDPETNLPVEYRHVGTIDGWEYTDQATDFRWNIAIDPKMFEPVIPQGYDDTTPPTDKGDLDQIAAALRLYAQLSGGHYPQTREFDPAAIRDEMIKLADAATPADPAAREQKHREIDQALAGLNWIARILRNRIVSGYRGLNVGPADKDQVLLWWNASNDRYHVFYGDLRFDVLTLTLTKAEWSKLVPPAENVGPPPSE